MPLYLSVCGFEILVKYSGTDMKTVNLNKATEATMLTVVPGGNLLITRTAKTEVQVYMTIKK